MEDPSDLTVQTIILYPEALPAETLSTDRQDRMYLVATPGPLSWAQVQQLNTHGIVGVSRQVLADPPEPDEIDAALAAQAATEAAIGLSAVTAMAILEIVLLAGAAFAVGARRRRRELALVAAVGGKPAHVRRIVLANGVVLGAIGAIVGVLLGVATALAAIPLLETAHNQRAAELRVFPVAQLAMAGAAILTGMLAALVPAWVAARQDVVTALAGRRGAIRSRKRWLVMGVLLAAGGAVVSVLGAQNLALPLVLGGMAIVELGLVVCTPALVGLVARIGGLLPLAPRIALRDTARNRSAAAPAISAVMAAVVGSVAIGVIMSAVQARNQQERRSASPIGTVTAQVGEPYAVTVERPPPTGNTTLVILAIIAGMITLGATAIATALAAAEGRADIATLAAVGASPRVRRRLSLSQSGVIAGLGSLIGTLAGLGAAMAFLLALNQGYAEVWPAPALFPLTVPWTNVAIALVAVPLVAMLGAGLLTSSRLPIERRL